MVATVTISGAYDVGDAAAIASYVNDYTDTTNSGATVFVLPDGNSQKFYVGVINTAPA